MSAINQLLAKAMSTTSEEEAMSCLRMARKKGNTFEGGVTSGLYKDKDAKHWYDKAAYYYNEAKKRDTANGLDERQQQILWNMYKEADANVARLSAEKRALERQLREMEMKPSGWWKLPVIALQAIIILTLVQMIN